MNEELLKILACPKCQTKVVLANAVGGDILICQNPICGASYPIRDGIPVLILEENLSK